MKHNWEYKRLGDVCDVYQPKTIASSELVVNGEYDVFGANGIIGKYSSYNHEFPEILLTCRGATCGTINVSNPKSWINGNAMVIHSKSKCLLFGYLRYIMTSFDYSNIITGAAQPQITRQSLTPTSVPVPPMEVQQQIVAELDKINEVIEDCRELLRNLDALAQSLFYDYFGDPIANPKNWEISKLDSLIQPKKNILRASKNFTQNDLITYIDISSINRNSNSISDPSVLVFGDAPSRAQQCVKHSDLLVSLVRPNLKNIALCSLTSNSLVASSGFCVLRSNNISNPNFLLHLLLSASTTEYLCSKISGAAYPAITENDIRDMHVPVPPLELQKKFAECIEQINAQKKAVEQTIAELQTLLNSRMDYWFND